MICLSLTLNCSLWVDIYINIKIIKFIVSKIIFFLSKYEGCLESNKRIGLALAAGELALSSWCQVPTLSMQPAIEACALCLSYFVYSGMLKWAQQLKVRAVIIIGFCWWKITNQFIARFVMFTAMKSRVKAEWGSSALI